MKRIKEIFLIALIFLGFITSASAQSDPVTTKEYTVEAFESIAVDGNTNVELSLGDTQKVVVVAPYSVQTQVNIKVKNGILKISDNSNGHAVVIITTPKINTLNVSGVAKVKNIDTLLMGDLNIKLSGASNTSLDIQVDRLNTEMGGASSAVFVGTVNHHNIKQSGAAMLDAKKLITQSAEVETSGASKAIINVLMEVSGKNTGISVIDMVSEPKINRIVNEGIAGKLAQQKISDSLYINLEEALEDNGNTKILVHKDTIMKKEIKKLRKKGKFDPHWNGIELGVNSFVNNDNQFKLPENADFLTLKIPNSLVVNLNLVEAPLPVIKNNFGLYTGFGFEFNNYKFANDYWIEKDDSLETLVGIDAAPKTFIKSKLSATYLKVPVMMEFQTHNSSKFFVAVGGAFGLRIASKTKYKYEENGSKTKEKIRGDYYLNAFKADVMAKIGWGPLNFFASYALLTMFEEGKGPELYPVSFGFSLFI